MQIECFIFGTYLPNTYIHLKINVGFFFALQKNAKINLDFAARVIHGIALPESVMKTRIRRLYDIANILQSLQLIQKVQVQEASGIKKPAFQYIGPDLDAIGKYFYNFLFAGFLFGHPQLKKVLKT